MTTMGILEQKGHLKKSAAERAHVYSPTQAQGTVVKNMVHDFVQRVFNGSAKPLLVHLLEDPKISAEELEELPLEALVVPLADTTSPTCPESETIVPSSGA